MAIAANDNVPKKISLTIFDWEESWKLANAMHALASASIMPLFVVKKWI